VTLQRTPAVDHRTGADIERQLREQLGLNREPGDPLAEALVGVLARYSELIIQRLNQVPDKQFLAFLDTLGVTPAPPTAARVALTFQAVRGLPPGQSQVAVPQHTRAAAPPAPGTTEPAVFETERPLLLSDAALARIIALDPAADDYADCPDPAARQAQPEAPLLDARRPLEHELYLAHSGVFGSPGLRRLRLHLDIAGSAPGQQVAWFIPGPDGPHPLSPARDGTCHLTGSGEVLFEDLPQWPAHGLFGRERHWLGCRLLSGLPPDREPVYLRSLRISAEWDQDDAELQQLFCNRLPLDPGGAFHPLGERPHYGDAFYLGSDAFARPGSRVILQIRLANPAGADPAQSPLPPVYAAGRPQLLWQAWDGRRWQALTCRDGTAALTVDGAVALTLPEWIRPTELNGIPGHWLRARLSAGHYGEEARLELDGGQLRQIPATLAPPVITELTAQASVSLRGLIPDTVLTRNGLQLRSGTAGLRPFEPADTPGRTLYLGLRLPPGRLPIGRPLDLYLQPEAPPGRPFVRGSASQGRPGLSWQYWDGKNWRPCPAQDDTDAGQRPGLVRLQPGTDLARWRHCALEDAADLYWLRLLMDDAQGEIPLPRRLLLNTVPARHVLTLENELLGSSNGKPDQTFRCNRTPVLDGVALEVREPDLPEAPQLLALRRQAGEEAVREERDQRGRRLGVWVRWHEMPNLLRSDGTDRHFLLDHQRGLIRFGDGEHGRIPPAGSNSIRLRRYRTGGGESGNQPAGSVSQLRSSVPFVDSVVNADAAAGGWEREAQRSLLERGVSLLRHRGRAVTARDYEDLARQASPEVARASCYPLRDLATAPDGSEPRPGVVSLVLVPRSDKAAPRPSPELLRRVHGFLERHGAPGIGLVVLAPEYLRVEVEAELVPAREELPADLTGTCARRLAAFLHPLHGGVAGEGWAYGQRPRRSDLFALLESAPGVDHVRSLYIHTEEERPGLERCGLFQVCSGRHRLRLSLGF
jgi:hypothetical protein